MQLERSLFNTIFIKMKDCSSLSLIGNNLLDMNFFSTNPKIREDERPLKEVVPQTIDLTSCDQIILSIYTCKELEE